MKSNVERHPVERYTAQFDAPPRLTPADNGVDGPLLGNGDMGVCLSGPPELLRFHLSKNDFWKLRSNASACGPRPVGVLEIRIPALAGAGYRVEQRLLDVVTTGSFRTGSGLDIRMETWVAATDNTLVISLTAAGGEADAELRLTPGPYHGELSEAQKEGKNWAAPDTSISRDGCESGVAWIERRYDREVDIPTAAAAALKLSGADSLSFRLTPDRPILAVVAMASGFTHPDPADHARRRVVELCGNSPDPAQPAIASLRRAHEEWWRDYWERSWIEIGDPALEKLYYQSLYVLGATSRDPRFPSGLFGVWVTTDSPKWRGDYHLNFNHQAPYYGLCSANRMEQADPEIGPVLDFIERGRWYARHVTHTRGALYPVGIGPLGIEATRDHPTYGPDIVECGGMFFGQRSNAAYCLVNIAERWRRTYDPDYGRRVWPFVSDVLTFWEDYLELQPVGGTTEGEGSIKRYVIVADSIHENSGRDVNPILSLGLIRNALDLGLDLIRTLSLDEPERAAKWRDISERLSEFPTQERKGRTVFRMTELGKDWWHINTLAIQHIYPAAAIGPESPPRLLEIARNTVAEMSRWRDKIGMCNFFPAAARVGFDPTVILSELRRAATGHTEPNGFWKNERALQDCCIAPNTLNEMLCMSHGHVLRLFPAWPRDRDASFHKIRAWGAFLVSATLREGVVRDMRIFSERGRDCALLNPWPGRAVRIRRKNGTTETITGDKVVFSTKAGEDIIVEPED